VGVRVWITDVTKGDAEACLAAAKALPVHSRSAQWQAKKPSEFCYRGELGRLPGSTAVISQWMPVAKIELDSLVFPRKGNRRLRFSVALVSSKTDRKLTCAECDQVFENTSFGYVDLQENVQQTKTLAVVLAFTVSAADGKLYDCEIDVIRDWARGNIDYAEISEAARKQFEKALDQTVEFFRNGHQVDSEKICAEITEIVPVSDRYEIVNLCLEVARAKGRASAEDLELLKKVSVWLGIDADRFRAMTAKILPVNMHEVEDVEIVLGVTSDMDNEATRRRLNDEYRKWNARVTSTNPDVQMQADSMLKFIAEARNQSRCGMLQSREPPAPGSSESVHRS
jgi:tellurite resistance protein